MSQVLGEAEIFWEKDQVYCSSGNVDSLFDNDFWGEMHSFSLKPQK
jgi:hypothetical protein